MLYYFINICTSRRTEYVSMPFCKQFNKYSYVYYNMFYTECRECKFTTNLLCMYSVCILCSRAMDLHYIHWIQGPFADLQSCSIVILYTYSPVKQSWATLSSAIRIFSFGIYWNTLWVSHDNFFNRLRLCIKEFCENKYSQRCILYCSWTYTKII